MHEAEQICDRVAILINGKVIVVGTMEELRRKYGQGQSISLYFSSKAKEVDQTVEQFKDKIKDQSPELDVKLAKGDNERVFKISNEQIKFSVLFQVLYDMKSEKMIKDFSIAQASLEQVFLYFARFQSNE